MLRVLMVLLASWSLVITGGCKKSQKKTSQAAGDPRLEGSMASKKKNIGLSANSSLTTIEKDKGEGTDSGEGEKPGQEVDVAGFSVEEFTLSNGLKVFFSKSDDSPEFYSEIVVRAGSKHEQPGATGLAHYLEHLMFKGTDQIGTVDFEKENAINQQIIAKYDERKAAASDEEKAKISAEIDQLSLQAAKYVIPGDYESMLNHFGHQYLNAHTNYDETVYYMGMPKNRFSQWAKIQSQVFSKPQVARGFQWELEIVYEEKNRRANPAVTLLNLAKESIFGGHGYGRSIIGSTEDLKNPSIQQTIDFFKQYYVPSNLGIIISGDLEADEVRKTLEETFGKIPAGKAPVYNPPNVKMPTERVVTKSTFDKEPFVAISYLAPGATSEDAAVFQVLLDVLSNDKIGILDQLNHKQKIYGASSGVFSAGLLTEHNHFYLSAGIQELEGGKLKKSHEQTEQELLQVIEIVKKGDFSEELLAAVKTNYLLTNGFLNESNRTKVGALRQAFIHGIPWSEYKNTVDKIMAVSKKDLQDFAIKYFSKGYVVSEMHRGQGELEQVSKPKITPMAGKTAKGDSAFKKKMVAEEVQPIEPSPLDFNKYVEKVSSGDTTFVAVKNPINDLADFEIKFDFGQLSDAKLCYLVGTILHAGVGAKPALEVKKDLYELGVGNLQLSCGLEKTALQFSAVESRLPEILKLIGELLKEPKIEGSLLTYMVNNGLRSATEARKKASNVVQAALRYFLVGDESLNKLGLSSKESLALTPADVAKAGQRLLAAPRTVYLTGKTSIQDLQALVEKTIPFAEKAVPGKMRKPLQVATVNKPTIYFYHTPGGAQANVRFIYPSETFKAQDHQSSVIDRIFTKYYAHGFSAVIMQELREKRSLGYSPSGNYPVSSKLTGRIRDGDQKVFVGELNTQTDKLEEGLAVFQAIMKDMIWDEGRMLAAKKSYQLEIAGKIGFRHISGAYAAWTSLGHNSDPRVDRMQALSSVNIDLIKERMEANIASKAPIILVVGDKSKIDLAQFDGKISVIELSEKDIFSEL